MMLQGYQDSSILHMDHHPLQMTFLRAGPMTFIIQIYKTYRIYNTKWTYKVGFLLTDLPQVVQSKSWTRKNHVTWLHFTIFLLFLSLPLLPLPFLFRLQDSESLAYLIHQSIEMAKQGSSLTPSGCITHHYLHFLCSGHSQLYTPARHHTDRLITCKFLCLVQQVGCFGLTSQRQCSEWPVSEKLHLGSRANVIIETLVQLGFRFDISH